MTDAEAIKGIRKAAKHREQAEQARKTATAELLRFVREAQSAGVSISQIAREAGLSRQGVYDLLATRPS
jgi:DNA-binding phage protein